MDLRLDRFDSQLNDDGHAATDRLVFIEIYRNFHLTVKKRLLLSENRTMDADLEVFKKEANQKVLVRSSLDASEPLLPFLCKGYSMFET